MTQHPTNQSSVYGVLLRGFVITLVVAANGFQAARAETALSMMEVSDRMPASPTSDADAKTAVAQPTNQGQEWGDSFVPTELRQPQLTQFPSRPGAAADAHTAQPQPFAAKNASPINNQPLASAMQQGQAYVASELRQPITTQGAQQSATMPKPFAAQSQSTSAADNKATEPVQSNSLPNQSDSLASSGLMQPDLSALYATAVAVSHAGQEKLVGAITGKSNEAASANSAPSQNHSYASSGLQQPDLSPLYSAANVESQAPASQAANVKSSKPTESASTNSAPSQGGAYIASNLKQPEIAQFPSYSRSTAIAAAPQVPSVATTNVKTTEAAPAISAPTRGDAYASSELQQPNLSPVYSPAAPAPVAVQPQVVEKQVAKSDTAVAAAPAGDKAVATTNSAKPEATQSPAYSASPFASVPLAESTPTGDITNTNVIPSEPAPVVPAPSRGDAYAAAGLKQPNLSPQYSAPAPAVAVPAKTVATTVTTQPVASSAAGDSSTPVRGQFAITKSTTDYPVTSVTEPSPAATSPTPAPQACATCSLPYGCAYGPGQSGAPNICGVNCGACGAPCSATWCDAKCIPWSLFGPGEYVGPPRTEHVSTYYLRVNDLIRLTYITSHNKVTEQYRIRVGDKMRIEWLRLESGKDAPLDRDMLVQPDGTVTLPLVGQVAASGKTIEAFRDDVVKLFSHYQKDPQITITPIEVNTDLQDIVRAVTSVSGSNGQSQDFRVTPEGTIQASGLGSVYVQGLTLDELKSELEARYAAAFGPGLIVSPSLTEHATSFVFVGGEVAKPGRFTLEGPTTVMQAITMAGSWNVGGNTRQVVVFRRDENWCLKATKINLHAPLYGQDPCPVNDVWLRDNDLVIVPKERILCADDVINLYFTRGAYSVFPITFVKDFSTGTAIAPIP